MQVHGISVIADQFRFVEQFRSRFSVTIDMMAEVLFARATVESSQGFMLSAQNTILFTLELIRMSNSTIQPYACGLAAQILLDNGQIADARMICLQGMEIANPDVLPDLSRLLDIISGESWKE